MSDRCFVKALTLYHVTVSQASHDNIVRQMQNSMEKIYSE